MQACVCVCVHVCVCVWPPCRPHGGRRNHAWLPACECTCRGGMCLAYKGHDDDDQLCLHAGAMQPMWQIKRATHPRRPFASMRIYAHMHASHSLIGMHVPAAVSFVSCICGVIVWSVPSLGRCYGSCRSAFGLDIYMACFACVSPL